MPHRCAASGCKRVVRDDMLMCRADWFRVPKWIRDEVWRAWDDGRGKLSPQHVRAIEAAVAAVDAAKGAR
jgi:hypothetical protein